MLIIVITTCYFAKVKTDQAENMNNFRRSPRLRDSDDTDRNERRLSRRNPSGRTLRSGSNSSSERRIGRSSSNQGESPGARKDEFLPRERNLGHSRRLSGGNSRQVTDTLSKSNLDRLSRQANSVKVKQASIKNLSDSHHKHGSEKRTKGEPALLFVEDEHLIMNPFGSSFVTTNRSSGLRVVSDRDQEASAASQEAGSNLERNSH